MFSENQNKEETIVERHEMTKTAGVTTSAMFDAKTGFGRGDEKIFTLAPIWLPHCPA